MALKSKTQDEIVPEEVTEQKQVTWDDLEFEAEYVPEEELESRKFYTISGKESQYEPNWEKYTIADLEVGDEFEGRPEITIFENKDKNYDAFRLRLMDDGEILDLYINYPKKEFPYVKGINKKFDFYRKCFDFIFSVLKWRDERNVVNADGEEINKFKSVNIENLAKLVDSMSRVGVKITEGNKDSEYDSWMIIKMEE